MSGHESLNAIHQPRLWRWAALCLLLLAAETYALFHDFGASGAKPLDPRAVIAKFEHGRGEVRQKREGTIAWYPPSLGDDLKRQDSILTMGASEAQIQFTDGATLTVEPDSLVVLEKTEAKPDDPYSKIVVQLVEGTVSKKAGNQGALAIQAGQTLIEDKQGDSLFKVSRSRSGDLRIEVEKGKLKLGQGASARIIAQGNQATLAGNRVEVKELKTVFSDFSPEPGKVIGREDNREPIELSWRATGVPMSQEVKARAARAPDFAKPLEINADNGRTTLQAPEDGPYYWQIGTSDGKSQGAVLSFSVVTLRSPEAEAPGDEQEVFVKKPVVFGWKTDGLSANRIWIETSATPGFIAAQRMESPVETGKMRAHFDAPGTIYWRLKADYGAAGTSKPTEVRQLIVKAKPRIKTPRLKPARIHFGMRGKATEAAPPLSAVQKTSQPVTIELEWEEVDDAKLYRLQVAETPDFARLLIDRKVKGNAFALKTLQTAAKRVLFFRIASIDADGEESDFSAGEKVEIEAFAPPKPLLPPPPPAPRAPDSADPDRFRIDLKIGGAYHSRTFKNASATPLTSSGSGMIPALAGIEARKLLGKSASLDLGFSALAEQAETNTANVIDEKFAIPLARAWAMLEDELWGQTGGAGLYASTSQRFTWNGLSAANARVVLLGASASFSNAQLKPIGWQWRAQAAFIAVGGLGADLDLGLRKYLFSRRPMPAAAESGFFGEVGAVGRYLNIETSYGGTLELGYTF